MSKLDGLIAAREMAYKKLVIELAIIVASMAAPDNQKRIGRELQNCESADLEYLAIAAERQSGERGEWRCFHCDETFSTIETAREHFGASQDAEPACKIDIAEYRRLEDQQASCRAECCEEAKRYYAMQADHAQALIREEQKGYDKGLADGRVSPRPTATDPVAGVSEVDWWLNHFARWDTHLTTLTIKECIDRVKAKREHLGRVVREAWVTWASHYPSSKPSWLVPYDELSESDKETDRRIGESVFRDTLTALRARSNEETFAEGVEAAAVKAEENKLYWARKVDPLNFSDASNAVWRAKSAACFQVEMDIRSLTAPEKKGSGE